MTRLTIREASEKFGLSRARLYKLLEEGKIDGVLSRRQGRVARSWVDMDSLNKHLEFRDEKPRLAACVIGDETYVSVRIAAQQSGYSRTHIYSLLSSGSVRFKRPKKRKGWLVHLIDLLNLKGKKILNAVDTK